MKSVFCINQVLCSLVRLWPADIFNIEAILICVEVSYWRFSISIDCSVPTTYIYIYTPLIYIGK